MTARGAVLALLIAAAAFGAAQVPETELGIALAVVAAFVGAALWQRLDARRVRKLAERINAIVGSRESGASPLGRSEAWRQLDLAVTTLADAYRRQGDRLEQERPWRRELVDSLVQPALLFSSGSRLLSANEAARELLGIPDASEGITVVQALGSAVLAEAVREVRTVGRPVTLDVEHGPHHLRASVSAVGDEILMIIIDRTRELRVEEVRRNFVVNASHELKTPVTSIQTLAEALEVTLRSDPSRAQPLVRQLGEEAERLARLVRDMLDLRRLEERGPLERVPVDLAELARRAVAEQASRAEERELTVGVDAPEPVVVAGVPGDLEVVVKNLVANAIQYNQPGGSVEVQVAVREGRALLEVQDTGIGIPQQDRARIFERFYRVDTARSRATGGTGLGLSIVRHAVERHGGTIRVDSLLGQGSTFTVTLPIAD